MLSRTRISVPGTATASVHETATERPCRGAVPVTSGRDAPLVLQLTTLLRSVLSGSLGNAGAVANARAVLEARVREDWVVEGLAHRLDPAVPTPAPARRDAA